MEKHEVKQVKPKFISLKTSLIISGILLALAMILISVKVPYSAQETYTEQDPYTDHSCTTRQYNYNADWSQNQWDFSNGKMSPFLEIANLEKQPGIFYVQFAFFDQNYFPYNDAAANWNNANVYSEKKGFDFAPYERRTIEIPTGIKNPTASYWGMQTITPPIFNDCTDTTKYTTVEKNRTVTKYETLLESLMRKHK